MSTSTRSPRVATGLFHFYHFSLLLATSLCLLSLAAAQPNRRWHQRHQGQTTQITDFRYKSARIDGITRLFNDSLIVISNGHYWLLANDELPRLYNVRGPISHLYSGMSRIDAIWTDPYNDISPQIYLASTSPTHGLRVVCKEFDDEEFTSESSFCHLPVSSAWKAALKDLNFDKPIDAVTWRNRTKDKDGGFWVFFQGKKMITIDPLEMRLRYTYDISKWMNISEPITATFYDYRTHVYHFFFNQNGYRTWQVNVTFMNNLPMSWDRAFLHGTLSPLMKINRDFFGFGEHELRNWPQPNLETVAPIAEINGNHLNSKVVDRSTVRPSSTTTTTRRPTTTTRRSSTRQWTTTESSISDVMYVSPRGEQVYGTSRKGEMKVDESEDIARGANSIEQMEASESVSYQKQLMELEKEGVRDFASNTEGGDDVNAAGLQSLSHPFIAASCFCSLLYMLFSIRFT